MAMKKKTEIPASEGSKWGGQTGVGGGKIGSSWGRDKSGWTNKATLLKPGSEPLDVEVGAMDELDEAQRLIHAEEESRAKRQVIADRRAKDGARQDLALDSQVFVGLVFAHRDDCERFIAACKLPEWARDEEWLDGYSVCQGLGVPIEVFDLQDVQPVKPEVWKQFALPVKMRRG